MVELLNEFEKTYDKIKDKSISELIEIIELEIKCVSLGSMPPLYRESLTAYYKKNICTPMKNVSSNQLISELERRSAYRFVLIIIFIDTFSKYGKRGTVSYWFSETVLAYVVDTFIDGKDQEKYYNFMEFMINGF